MSSPEYCRAYYYEHRESLLERAKKWAKENRTRINANRRYRYRVDAEYRRTEIDRVVARQKRIRNHE